MGWLIALMIVAAPPSEADRAIDVLAGCEDVNAERCIVAAARLKILGADALAPLSKRIESLGTAGQILALSVVSDTTEEAAGDVLHKLAKSTNADGAVRALALDGLARRRDVRVPKLVPRLLGDRDPLVRQAAVRAVSNVVTPRDKRSIGQLKKAAGDPVAAVRAEAAFGLGFCGCAEAGPVLTKALGDDSDQVRHAAAEGLVLVRHPAAIDELVTALRATDPLVARAAARALRFQTGENLSDDAEAWERWLAARK